jgi:hypothetical protein
MFITKKHLDRRTFLKSTGVAVALPLPDAMIPAATALAQTPARGTPRFVGLFVPHGAAPGYWVPEKEGALPGALPFNWQPHEPFRNRAVIISGLHARSAEPPPGVTGADHWVAAAFMCAEKSGKWSGLQLERTSGWSPTQRTSIGDCFIQFAIGGLSGLRVATG